MNLTTSSFLAQLDHESASGITEVSIWEGSAPSHVGYFDDLQKRLQAILSFDGKANVYVTLNPCKRDLLARANNRLKKLGYKDKERTKDNEILCDSWFFIDIDPRRPSGISSSEAELIAAQEVSKNILGWLLSIGVPIESTVTARSGNGCYILVRLPDYPITEPNRLLKQAIINFIADHHDTPQIEIDRTVFNAARLIGALGTLKMKGENIAERPHRRSAIITVGGVPFNPDESQIVQPFDLYSLLADRIPRPEEPARKARFDNYQSAFDIREHTDELHNEKKTSRGYAYYNCPACDGEQKLYICEKTGAYGCWHKCTPAEIRTAKGWERQARSLRLTNSTPKLTANKTVVDVPNDPVDSRQQQRLSISYADFFNQVFTESERIAFELERGECGLLVAMPNAGKTTLALNAGLSLCVGHAFNPVVEAGKPRRVLIIDAETRPRRLQRDLRWLIRRFTPDAQAIIKANLSIICDAEINGESLSLTNETHFAYLADEIYTLKPDFIVIDTLSATFHVYNENDNAEQNRKVWRPLQKLARNSDAAILVTHHVGKRQSEEGATPDRMYRGRGASSSGAAARAVWTLDVDKISKLTTLALVKAKGKAEFETTLQLGESRWFEPVEQIKVKTSYDVLLETIKGEMETAEIVQAVRLQTKESERTVKKLLKRAVENGHLLKGKRGTYLKPDRAACEESANPTVAQAARVSQSQESGLEVCATVQNGVSGKTSVNGQKQSDLRVRATCATPIGNAQVAQTLIGDDEEVF